MASPFLPVADRAVIKVEDDESDSGVPGLVSSEEELRNKFWEDVRRRVELRNRARRSASGSAQHQQPPPPHPPVQPPHAPSPPPPLPLPLPPPPPPPAHRPWTKRPATAPPPWLAGVRQPPLKQYQRRPPGQRAPAPDAHRTAGPAPNTCHAQAPSARPPARMPPPLQRRSAPKPPRPAARNKPTVPCALCGVLCMTAWHLELHQLGRKHRNKVACLAGEMSVRCEVCDVPLSGALNVQQHYAGKQHLWRLNGGA